MIAIVNLPEQRRLLFSWSSHNVLTEGHLFEADDVML
jgi:hypothetical protein